VRALRRLLDALDERFNRERLDDVRVEARLECAFLVGLVAVAGERDQPRQGARDLVSGEILEDIFDDTEWHVDFLETQIDLIGEVGLQNYLQSQMGEPN
jgi:hypothetical protein